MIKSTLTTGCEKVVIDGATNSVSIMGVIEEIRAPQFPIMIPKLALLFTLERSASDAEKPDAKVRFTLGGQLLAEIKVIVDFQTHLRTRCVLNVEQLVLPNPGPLAAELVLAGKSLTTWAIEARKDSTVYKPVVPKMYNASQA